MASFLPHPWSVAFLTPERTAALAGVALLAFLLAARLMHGSWSQRAAHGGTAALIVAVVGPASVSTVFASAGTVHWLTGLLSVAVFITSAGLYAALWATGRVKRPGQVVTALAGVALLATTAHLLVLQAWAWIVPFAFSIALSLPVTALLARGRGARHGGWIVDAVLLSLPVALTGVPWLAAVPLGLLVLGEVPDVIFRHRTQATCRLVAGTVAFGLAAVLPAALQAYSGLNHPLFY